MDQFEAARLKSAKREAKRMTFIPAEQSSAEPEIPEVPQIIKERPKKDGTFTVLVEMPHASFKFVITKPSILSHATPNRLTKAEIRKHIMEGLKPLLGGME